MRGRKRRLQRWRMTSLITRTTSTMVSAPVCSRMEDLRDLPLFGPALAAMQARYPACERERLMNEVVREVIGMMIGDLLDTTGHRLELLQPRTVIDIRHAKQAIVGFSFGMTQNIDLLRGFLHQRMYKHTKVNRICAKARHIVKDLFAFFMAEPSCLPNGWFDLLQTKDDPAARARVIADYIAGMTDRFAVQEHRKLFSAETMV